MAAAIPLNLIASGFAFALDQGPHLLAQNIVYDQFYGTARLDMVFDRGSGVKGIGVVLRQGKLLRLGILCFDGGRG